MYQTIEEEISVAGVFVQGSFRPKKFRWPGRVFPIEEITLAAVARDGGILYQHFSVMSKGNLYRLRYNRDSQHWQLAELWCEG